MEPLWIFSSSLLSLYSSRSRRSRLFFYRPFSLPFSFLSCLYRAWCFSFLLFSFFFNSFSQTFLSKGMTLIVHFIMRANTCYYSLIVFSIFLVLWKKYNRYLSPSWILLFFYFPGFEFLLISKVVKVGNNWLKKVIQHRAVEARSKMVIHREVAGCWGVGRRRRRGGGRSGWRIADRAEISKTWRSAPAGLQPLITEIFIYMLNIVPRRCLEYSCTYVCI